MRLLVLVWAPSCYAMHSMLGGGVGVGDTYHLRGFAVWLECGGPTNLVCFATVPDATIAPGLQSRPGLNLGVCAACPCDHGSRIANKPACNTLSVSPPLQALWDAVDVDRVKQCCDPAASADLAAVLITVRRPQPAGLQC